MYLKTYLFHISSYRCDVIVVLLTVICHYCLFMQFSSVETVWTTGDSFVQHGSQRTTETFRSNPCMLEVCVCCVDGEGCSGKTFFSTPFKEEQHWMSSSSTVVAATSGRSAASSWSCWKTRSSFTSGTLAWSYRFVFDRKGTWGQQALIQPKLIWSINFPVVLWLQLLII